MCFINFRKGEAGLISCRFYDILLKHILILERWKLFFIGLSPIFRSRIRHKCTCNLMILLFNYYLYQLVYSLLNKIQDIFENISESWFSSNILQDVIFLAFFKLF